MGDIRQSLLPRDVLSAAKELLYHLDIYICNLLQSGRQPPQVDSKTLELVEEFILHTPKDRNTSARVRCHTRAHTHSAYAHVWTRFTVCSCLPEDDSPPGAPAVGDHVQLFSGTEPRRRPSTHVLRPLRSPRQPGGREPHGAFRQTSVHGDRSGQGSDPGMCCYLAAGEPLAWVWTCRRRTVW